MPVLILIVGALLVFNGWMIGAQAESAMHQVYGGLYVVGGCVVMALAYIGHAVNQVRAASVAAAKAAPTAKVEASEAKAREVKTADAGGAPVLAPIISDANTILCQKCGRTNRIDARRCACGAAL